MALEEVTAKLVCRSLAIVLAIVCPRGGSRTGRLGGRARTHDGADGEGGVSDGERRTGRGKRVGTGHRGAGLKEGMGEEPEGLTGTGGVTSASRSDRDFDPGRAGFGEIHGEGGEQRGERVCGIAVQRVLELRVAAEGKDVRAETEIHRPRAVAGWQGKGIIGQPCDRGIGIVGA